ncbi:hypothetical protein DYB32_001418 [Aphanomyces invadans]|uniref:STAS domain-containing protein n=1 Tax=Aphanomyces invadans TaxID=157072 RepID=A0A418B6L7_9STRA|nr:hypothetical protein DYB32_001418 [Aphanomyces invadans]
MLNYDCENWVLSGYDSTPSTPTACLLPQKKRQRCTEMATNSMGSVCNTPRDHTRAARYSSHSLISIEPSAVYPPVEGETSSSENAIKAAMYGFINAIFLIPVTMVHLSGNDRLIFLSAISSSIVTMLSADKDLPPSAVIATTLVTLSSATMLMGLALILTGHYKLASLVQYLPMPVIGGYLSFIGFFCLEAGMGLMAGVEIKNIMDWWKLSNTAALVHILPGILCGLVLFVMSSKVQHFLVLPCCLTFILLSFYAFLVVSGLTFDDVRHAGWVSYAPAAVSSPLDVFDLFDFSLVQWRVIPKQIVTWLGMYFVVAFSSSLDVAAIEMNMGTELDYNHELKTVGWSNAVSGLCGGFTGSYIFSQTIFTLKSTTNSRIPGIVVLVSELIIFVLPLAVTAYIPKCKGRGGHLRFREYLIVVSTFVLINVLGLESGMLGGLVCAMTNFVFTYSEGVSVLKMFSRSRVQRNYQDRQYLTKHQCQIVALELHGYFFFGSSIRLVEHIKNNIYVDASKSNRSIAKESTPLLVGGVESSFAEEDPTRFICTLKDLDDLHGSSLGQRKTMLEPETRPTQFLLLDFQHVTGIDATASRSCFQAIKTILARHSITLMFSRMSADLERQLEKNQVLNDADADSIMIFKSVDAGLEFCENMLLNERPPPTPSTALQAKDLFPKAKRTTIMNVSTLTSVLSTALESWSTDGVNLLVEPTHNMEKYFTKKVLAAGERVFSQSDTTSSLFVVGSGELEVYKETTHSSAPNRIIKVSEGSLVGDVDFYLEQERSFTCQATSPSVVYELTRESLDRMVKSDPLLCTAIQTVFLKCMSLGVHNHLLVNHNPLSDK